MYLLIIILHFHYNVFSIKYYLISKITYNKFLKSTGKIKEVCNLSKKFNPRTLAFSRYYWMNKTSMNEYDEEKFVAQLRCYEISDVEDKMGYFPTNNN